jgi:hypothetical protein
MSITFLKRKPLLLLYLVGIILLAVAAWLSWSNLSAKPDRVFWSMIDQSLSTSAVTVRATQGAGANGAEQLTQFSFGGETISHSITNSSQPGTSVQAEMISTSKAGYVKYQVKTNQKNQAGKPLDFSKINGVWAKNDSGQQQLSQDLLGTDMPLGGVAVPIANLTPDVRQKMIAQIKQQGVYTTSFNSAKKETQNGRSVYIYNVSVKPVAYASMMKLLAKDIGLHDLDSLDVSNFEGKDSFELLLTVDIHDKQRLKAEATNADIHQMYSAYDIPVSIALPKQTISSTELQKRIQAAQQ